MIITNRTVRVKPSSDWVERIKPSTSYVEREKPDTDWLGRTRPTTSYIERRKPYKYITPLRDYVDLVCNENGVIIHIFANEGKVLPTIWQTR